MIKGVKESDVQRHKMSLVTHLFLSLQSFLNADMMGFFQYENQKGPLSLAHRGSLRSGTKSDILRCLNVPTGHDAAAKDATVMVLDNAAVIHMVLSTSSKTFNDYVSLHIVPYLESLIRKNTQCINAIWDNCPQEKTLKLLTQR